MNKLFLCLTILILFCGCNKPNNRGIWSDNIPADQGPVAIATNALSVPLSGVTGAGGLAASNSITASNIVGGLPYVANSAGVGTNLWNFLTLTNFGHASFESNFVVGSNGGILVRGGWSGSSVRPKGIRIGNPTANEYCDLYYLDQNNFYWTTASGAAPTFHILNTDNPINLKVGLPGKANTMAVNGAFSVTGHVSIASNLIVKGTIDGNAASITNAPVWKGKWLYNSTTKAAGAYVFGWGSSGDDCTVPLNHGLKTLRIRFLWHATNTVMQEAATCTGLFFNVSYSLATAAGTGSSTNYYLPAPSVTVDGIHVGCETTITWATPWKPANDYSHFAASLYNGNTGRVGVCGVHLDMELAP